MLMLMQLVVALVQINVDFDSEYLPYSVGLLRAFAESDLWIRKNFKFLNPEYRRLTDMDQIVERIYKADIIGFSSYVWNTQYNLELAKRIKARNPKATIVFGGPHVPDQAEGFLRENPFIDMTIHGEGELAFREFLTKFASRDWASIPSLRWIDCKTNLYHANALAPRVTDLDLIPSPYLSGVFDGIMAESSQDKWNVLWETNRGCPFSCTYCDWGSATQSRVNRFSMERLKKEIRWFQQNRVEYVMACDANFGMLERDIEIANDLAEAKSSSGYPSVLAATFTKNATERSYQIAQILTKAKLIRGYTVSTQSVDLNTLKNIKRQNISQKTFIELQARFNRDGLVTYSDLILGLPGETYETFCEGVAQVIKRGQYNKIYFLILSILPNAPMAAPEYIKEHGLETVRVPQKNLHENIKDRTDIEEFQELVIATKTLSAADWRRAICFAWMASLVYFNKLLHIPITLLLKQEGLEFRDIISAFLEIDSARFPIMARVNKIFSEKAAGIQKGDIEYCSSPDWLSVWWQPDKLAFMEICRVLPDFYREARALMHLLVAQKKLNVLPAMLEETMLLNQMLVRSPFSRRVPDLTLSRNYYEVYESILMQEPRELRTGSFLHKIEKFDESWADTNDWCKKVVWFANKTSAYLSECKLELKVPTAVLPKAQDEYSEIVNKPYLYT